MKKYGILVIALALLFLLTGFVMADPGVNATFETQGVALVTSIQATGNLYSTTDLTWSISSGGIITSGTDPTLAGYPNWDAYQFREGVGGYEQWLIDWAALQSFFPGFNLQDWNAFNQKYFPGDPLTLFLADLANWAAQQNVGGLKNTQLRDNEVRYTTTYSEETQSIGVGFINYDKDMNVETKAGLNGQSNLEATKVIAFEGINGAEITSTDNIFLQGTGEAQTTSARAICVFASDTSSTIPRFCNSVEAGSSFTMEVVNARTETNDRFVTDSADTPVEVNHNIRVDSLGDRTSVGKVSAFIEGSILEGREGTIPSVNVNEGIPEAPEQFLTLSDNGKSAAYEEVTFQESTTVDGIITLFDKDMAWESGIKRIRA
jgi:hypothetical protein